MRLNEECLLCPYRINAGFNAKDARLWRERSRQLGFSIVHECILWLYEDQGCTMSQIAEHFGVTYTSIRVRLYKYGAKIRQGGGTYKRPDWNKVLDNVDKRKEAQNGSSGK